MNLNEDTWELESDGEGETSYKTFWQEFGCERMVHKRGQGRYPQKWCVSLVLTFRVPNMACTP